MYWILTLLLTLLMVQRLNGKCTKSSINTCHRYHSFGDSCPPNIDCISVDEEELLSFIDGKEINQLNIENSFIPQVELFPTRHLNSLIIKNSRLKTFLATEFNNLEVLDLSFNEVTEIGCLKRTSIQELSMHHNQIGFLNGSNLPSKIENLDLSHNKIKNFTKLEHAQLNSLNLSHNSIESLADLLSDLRFVGHLDFSYNKLTNVKSDEISDLENLISLNLSHNDIQTFQFISHSRPGLRARRYNPDIHYNNPKGFLDLSFNKLTLSSDFLAEQFGELKSIYLENNELKDLNFFMSHEQRTIRVLTLSVRNNKINKLNPLNFKGLNILEKLDLSINEIESIVPATFEGSKINELCLAQNKISSLNSSSFSGLSSLERLNLSYNPLTVIDEMTFKNHQLLISIDLSHCLLKNIPSGLFGNKRDSSEFHSEYNNLGRDPDNFPYLQVLDISNNQLKKLPANVFSNLRASLYLDLSYNPLESIENIFNNTRTQNVTLTGISLSKLSEKSVRSLEKFKFLDLSDTSIEEVGNNTFDKFSSLETLKLDNNLIRMIPSNFFGFNKILMSLSIVGNPISMIASDSFPYKMKLKNLFLTLNGKLSRKRFFNLMFLEELHFVHSSVTDIQKNSFKGLMNLRTLKFRNSTVQKIEPGAFLGLTRVVNFDEQNLFHNVNTLKSKIFVGLKSLETLNVSSIGIGVIENDAFFGLDSLSNLTLSYNKIGDLPKNAFVGLKKLKMLDFSYNKLTGRESTFPIGIFRDLVELTELHLQHNRIIKFHIGEFSNLRNLKFLNLSHNQLSYLDRHLLFPLRNLEVLDINSNHVIKFDYHFTLKHLSSLKMIGIGENKWPCENLTIMLNDFEQHGINYREISKLEFEIENIGGIYCVHVCNYLYCPTEEDLVLT